MVIYALTLVIPLWVAVYTISFGRWLTRHQEGPAFPAYTLAVLSLAVSSTALWRILM